MNDKLWSMDKVADYLGVPKQTLYQWRTRGYGPEGIRIGKYIRYNESDVRAWVEEQKKVA